MQIDMTDIFDTHERQGKPKSLIDILRALARAEADLDGAGYRTDKLIELKHVRREQAVREFVVELARLKDARAQAAAAALDTYDAEQAAAASAAGGGRTVDVARLLSAQTVAEVALIVREAIASGDPAFARATWAHARPELWRRSRREFREEQMQGRNSALTVMTMLEAEMAALNVRQPARHSVAATQRASLDEIDRQALEIAGVLGLDQAVKAAAMRATVSAPAKASSGLVFGSFWERQER